MNRRAQEGGIGGPDPVTSLNDQRVRVEDLKSEESKLWNDRREFLYSSSMR